MKQQIPIVKSLCEFKNLHDTNNGDLWIVGSTKLKTIKVFNGNNSDAEVKKGYSKETNTNYFDVRCIRLKRFIKTQPKWV